MRRLKHGRTMARGCVGVEPRTIVAHFSVECWSVWTEEKTRRRRASDANQGVGSGVRVFVLPGPALPWPALPTDPRAGRWEGMNQSLVSVGQCQCQCQSGQSVSQSATSGLLPSLESENLGGLGLGPWGLGAGRGWGWTRSCSRIVM
jgi:hypothetical protein